MRNMILLENVTPLFVAGLTCIMHVRIRKLANTLCYDLISFVVLVLVISSYIKMLDNLQSI